MRPATVQARCSHEPIAVGQVKPLPWSSTAIRAAPLGSNAAVVEALGSALSVSPSCWSVDEDHSLTVPSWPPVVVNRWPVGSNAMLVTGPSATATGPATCSPVVGFHSWTIPPSVPVASVPLGANANETVSSAPSG